MLFDDQILKYLPKDIKNCLDGLDKSALNRITEIRVRAEKSMSIIMGNDDYLISNDFKLCKNCLDNYKPSKKNVMQMFLNITNNSLYAFSKELSRGYITLEGGHRVGLTGRVLIENNQIKGISDISGINIRIAKEIKGCSNFLMQYLISNNEVKNTLIISPPKCGKTTILRDITRNLSNLGKKIGVVDERSEIAACYNGIAQNDLGLRTDVLDGCPKQEGMEMLLRAMSPDVIITDELGNEGDERAIKSMINAGIGIIASAHGFDANNCKNEIKNMINSNIFKIIIVLVAIERPGEIMSVYDIEKERFVYKRGGTYDN